jgi:hypothetical protein
MGFMKIIAFITLLLIMSCTDPVSHKVDTINAVVTTGKVRTEHLPRVIIEAKVLQSYPKIETHIVLDFTDYLKTKRLPPANATYSVVLVRQNAPNYFFTVVSTMYDTK